MRWLVPLMLLCGTAQADPAADVNKAMQAFVDAAAAKKLPSEVDAFIGPSLDDKQALPTLGNLAAIVGKPKLKILATQVAKSGTAAWIVAEISGAKYASEGKASTAPLRASAFLSLDKGAWHVRAAHWSGGVPNAGPAGMCGLMDPSYEPPPNIAKGTEPVVKLIHEAFDGDVKGPGPSVLPVLSDDKNAQMFGSAPNETFNGGPAIKKVFKSWKIDLASDAGENSRTGIAPGGDLAWVAMDIGTMTLCVSYRVFFVLQKEGSGWKIVHQHYSSPVRSP